MNKYRHQYRSLSEDEEEELEDSGTSGESEYAFEGFDIVVNEKIMLTPVNQVVNDR